MSRPAFARLVPGYPRDSRLLATPCLVKLCENLEIRARSGDLVRGMYILREDFEALCESDLTCGPRGGHMLTYDNVPRYLNNTTFTTLLGDGLIGSLGTGTEFVAQQIEASLAANQSAVVGIRSTRDVDGFGRTGWFLRLD